jgi:hypothetical protein
MSGGHLMGSRKETSRDLGGHWEIADVMADVMRVTLVCAAVVASAAGVAQGQTRPRDTQMPQPSSSTTTTVSAASAAVHARCDEASPLRITLGRGETVTIVSVLDNWVSVKVNATGEEGCMRRASLTPTPAMTQSDQARRARQAAQAPGARRAASTQVAPRAVISVNGGYQSASQTFREEQTFSLHQETARYTSSYEVKSAPTVDAGGFVRLWRQVGVGVAFTSFKDDRDITIEGTLPHPFVFDRGRAISGTAPGTREEIAVHLNAAYFLPLNRKLLIVAFGGPSFFSAKQSVVGTISYSESYPYDTATFTSANVEQEKESKVGFNVGADVSYYFTKYIGVGGIVRFSRASVPFSLGDLDVGGAEVGGGIRIRIP